MFIFACSLRAVGRYAMLARLSLMAFCHCRIGAFVLRWSFCSVPSVKVYAFCSSVPFLRKTTFFVQFKLDGHYLRCVVIVSDPLLYVYLLLLYSPFSVAPRDLRLLLSTHCPTFRCTLVKHVSIKLLRYIVQLFVNVLLHTSSVSSVISSCPNNRFLARDIQQLSRSSPAQDVQSQSQRYRPDGDPRPSPCILYYFNFIVLLCV